MALVWFDSGRRQIWSSDVPEGFLREQTLMPGYKASVNPHWGHKASSLSNRHLFSFERGLQERSGINGMKKRYLRKEQRRFVWIQEEAERGYSCATHGIRKRAVGMKGKCLCKPRPQRYVATLLMEIKKQCCRVNNHRSGNRPKPGLSPGCVCCPPCCSLWHASGMSCSDHSQSCCLGGRGSPGLDLRCCGSTFFRNT